MMLGPSPEHPGGITKVVDSWREGGLGDLVSLREIHTSRLDDPWPRQAVHAVAALIALFWVLGRRQADVVHLHVSTGGSLLRKLAAAILARLFGVPYVAQIHSGQYEEWVAHNTIARTCSRLLFSNAAITAVVSERWVGLARRIGGKEVLVLPNALSLHEREVLAAAAAAVSTESTGPPVLLYYGRWSPVKGPDRIAAALTTAPPAGYEVRLFGNGDRIWLEDTFAALPPDNVVIGGWIPLSAKAAELATATALVVPSRFEGFGRVLIEARAAGAPVVASAVGGVVDVLNGYDRALLVPAGDDRALRSALERVVSGDWPPPAGRSGRVPDLPDRYWAERVVAKLAAELERVTGPAAAGAGGHASG